MKKTILTLVIGSMLMIAVNVSAYTLTIGDPNTALSAYPSPYATLSITDFTNSKDATITLTGLNNAFYHYLIGGVNAVNLNINGTASLVGSVLFNGGSTSGGNPTAFSVTSGNVSRFGNFDLSFNDAGGFNNAVSSLTFIIHNDVAWADAAHVLTANNDGYLAAAHIFISNLDGTNTNVTGFAADGAAPVPEPGTMVLLGIGMLGLGIFGKRRLNKEA